MLNFKQLTVLVGATVFFVNLAAPASPTEATKTTPFKFVSPKGSHERSIICPTTPPVEIPVEEPKYTLEKVYQEVGKFCCHCEVKFRAFGFVDSNDFAFLDFFADEFKKIDTQKNPELERAKASVDPCFRLAKDALVKLEYDFQHGVTTKHLLIICIFMFKKLKNLVFDYEMLLKNPADFQLLKVKFKKSKKDLYTYFDRFDAESKVLYPEKNEDASECDSKCGCCV